MKARVWTSLAHWEDKKIHLGYHWNLEVKVKEKEYVWLGVVFDNSKNR